MSIVTSYNEYEIDSSSPTSLSGTDVLSQSQLDALDRFHTNIMDFLSFLSELLPLLDDVDPTLFGLAATFLPNYNKKKLINSFISSTSSQWDQILKRDVTAFDTPIYIGPLNVSETAKSLFLNPKISSDAKDITWQYIISLVKISKNYQK